MVVIRSMNTEVSCLGVNPWSCLFPFCYLEKSLSKLSFLFSALKLIVPGLPFIFVRIIKWGQLYWRIVSPQKISNIILKQAWG